MAMTDVAESRVRTKPRILYVPVSPGFPDEDFLAHYTAGIRGGSVDVVVVETYMSGGIPSEPPYSVIPFIVDSAKHVPTFLVPEGQRPQDRRLRESIFYNLEGHPTALSLWMRLVQRRQAKSERILQESGSKTLPSSLPICGPNISSPKLGKKSHNLDI